MMSYLQRVDTARLGSLIDLLEKRKQPTMKLMAMLCESAPERFRAVSEAELTKMLDEVRAKFTAARAGTPWVTKPRYLRRRVEFNSAQPGWSRTIYDGDNLAAIFEWHCQDLLRSPQAAHITCCGQCSRLFVAKRIGTQFCSTACSRVGRAHSFYERHAERVRQSRRDRYRAERKADD
jgi:hypothetical protein